MLAVRTRVGRSGDGPVVPGGADTSFGNPVRMLRRRLPAERVVVGVHDGIAPLMQLPGRGIHVEVTRLPLGLVEHRDRNAAELVWTALLEASGEQEVSGETEAPARLVDERLHRGPLGHTVDATIEVPTAEHHVLVVRDLAAEVAGRPVPLGISFAAGTDDVAGDDPSVVEAFDLAFTREGERDIERDVGAVVDREGREAIEDHGRVHHVLGRDKDLGLAAVLSHQNVALLHTERDGGRRRRGRCRGRSGRRCRRGAGSRCRTTTGWRFGAATATTASGEDEECSEADGGRGNTLPHVGGDLLGCLHG